MTSQSPTGVVDPLDLLDFSEYDGLSSHSPSVSPTTISKPQFARANMKSTTPSTMPSQPMSGPSHQYDQYKQQTPFVPGALATTLAINENNSQITGYLDYVNPADDLFDFNTVPSQQSMSTPDMDIDFDSVSNSSFFYQQQPATINPNAIDSQDTQMRSPTIPSPPSSVGRMYPGMHQQQALAKAQAQQRQQQQIIQQKQQQQQQRQAGKQPQRAKAPLPTDPIVEQKITQLLNSMRSKISGPEAYEDSPLMNISKPRKDEDDMDEDERLLASEEGKKLSSKERRQLRNKVSARAFRSRRKEYIGQLESEIATKVSENGDLRAQNRALADENRRLTDLTRMLLSSPSFSNFLDHLSANPAALPQPQSHPEQTQPEPRQMPKDVNPFGTNQNQQQQIGMVMMPEQTMDFAMLNLNHDVSSYQPRVFAVLETPEMPEIPEINTELLSGKTSNFVGESLSADSDKTDAPVIEDIMSPLVDKVQTREVAKEQAEPRKTTVTDIYDEGFEASTGSSQPFEIDGANLSDIDIFGGVESEKVLARYELVDSCEEEAVATIALGRVERFSTVLEAVFQKLERLSLG